MSSIYILIFNCGSSSLNYKLFRTPDGESLETLAYGKAHRVGVQGSQPSFIEHHFQGKTIQSIQPITTHRQAAGLVLDHIQKEGFPIQLVGHRFVHGGTYFNQAAMITPQNQPYLNDTLRLAPIHNPNSMSVIEACQVLLPGILEYASFDTTFHASLPAWAFSYPLPPSWVKAYNLRKYGFHGLSYRYICREVQSFLNTPLSQLKMIACHLGTGGSSVTAVKNGQSLDTSMGYSPLPGLMMSTRCGDLDPLVPVYLMENESLTPSQINDLLNKKSGLLGVSGFSSDIRDIIQHNQQYQDFSSQLALNLYVGRLKKYIGAYTALMGGLDVLVFTDDIGVQNPLVRQETCSGMGWCGLGLDEQANLAAPVNQMTSIQRAGSSVTILSTPTDEELIIGLEGLSLLKENHLVNI